MNCYLFGRFEHPLLLLVLRQRGASTAGDMRHERFHQTTNRGERRASKSSSGEEGVPHRAGGQCVPPGITRLLARYAAVTECSGPAGFVVLFVSLGLDHPPPLPHFLISSKDPPHPLNISRMAWCHGCMVQRSTACFHVHTRVIAHTQHHLSDLYITAILLYQVLSTFHLRLYRHHSHTNRTNEARGKLAKRVPSWLP